MEVPIDEEKPLTGSHGEARMESPPNLTGFGSRRHLPAMEIRLPEEEGQRALSPTAEASSEQEEETFICEACERTVNVSRKEAHEALWCPILCGGGDAIGVEAPPEYAKALPGAGVNLTSPHVRVPVKKSPQGEVPEKQCVCGNIFMHDSNFCRKCGRRRLNNVDDREPPCCIQAIYYCVAFFAVWFGPAMFDFDGDGDFDAHDVDRFIEDGLGISPPRKILARKERLRQQKRERLSERVRRHVALRKVGKDKPDNASVTKFKTSSRDLCRLGEFEECRRQVKEHLKTPELAEELAKALADPSLKQVYKMDMDGEGMVDISDLMPVGIINHDTMEGHVAKRLSNGQARPIFTGLQCVVALGLWLLVTLRKDADLASSEAGFDSLFPGKTVLQIYDDSGLECKDLRFEVWRWVTYQFTHAGLLHVVVNVILTIVLGIPLEGLHGTRRMFLFFNAGVIGGALCNFFTALRHPVVGMSGGCYALFGLHFSSLVMNWQEGRFRTPAMLMLLTLAAADILSIQFGMVEEAVSHAAHLGGVIAGVCVGILLGSNLKVKIHERCFQVIAILLLLGMVACSGYWLSLWPPRSAWDPVPWCWARQVWNPDLPELGSADQWHCVRCADQACIDFWAKEEYLKSVNVLGCSTEYGWTMTGL
mmetsp:Transcript_87092/g.244301  ORF Transcript_87092/g.244301 Transcript_87092/m.244301 type:complete len:650 (-) Transcript_87092:157-2106(-)